MISSEVFVISPKENETGWPRGYNTSKPLRRRVQHIQSVLQLSTDSKVKLKETVTHLKVF